MITNFDYNYHTHTKRCNHAVDEDEKYILYGIYSGIKYLGFSEHIPLVREDGTESRYRMPLYKCQEYFDTLKTLREKYKNQIEINIGFEMEYYPDYFDVMIKTAKDYGAEYLILGQHFYVAEHNGGKYVLSPLIDEKDLNNYVDSVISAMNTGVFTYVAHPDIINFVGDKDFYKIEMRRLIETSKNLNVPLEINLLGVRENRVYPNSLFWQIAGEVGSPVVIGCDAHKSVDVYEKESIKKAFKMIKDFKLNYIGKPKIIRLDK